MEGFSRDSLAHAALSAADAYILAASEISFDEDGKMHLVFPWEEDHGTIEKEKIPMPEQKKF